MASDITSGCQITIFCSNHHGRLATGLWNKFLSKKGVDLDVGWGGRQVLAHSLVLDLFLSPEKLGRQRQSDSSLLDLLLEFLYVGRVAVRANQLGDLLNVANECDFELLVEALEQEIGLNKRKYNATRHQSGVTIKALRTCQSLATGNRKLAPATDQSNGVDQKVTPAKVAVANAAMRPILPKGDKKPVATSSSSVSAQLVRGNSSKNQNWEMQSKLIECTVTLVDDSDIADPPEPVNDCPDGWFIQTNEQQSDANNDREQFAGDDDGSNADQFDYDCFVPKIELLVEEEEEGEEVEREEGEYIEQPGELLLQEDNELNPTGNEETDQQDDVPDVDLFRCAVCETPFNLAADLKAHLRNFHPRTECKIPYKCNMCESGFQFCSQVEVHARKHRRRFTRPQKRHLVTSPAFGLPQKRLYVCDVPSCGKKFLAPCNLSHHKRCHLEKPQFPCSVCGKIYQYPVSLARHLRVQHKMETGESYPCDFCEAAFSSRLQLIRHTWTRHKK